MDTLRVILIVVGVIIIAAVYVFGRGRRRRADASMMHEGLDDAEYVDDVLLKDDPPEEALDQELKMLDSIVSEKRLEDLGGEPEAAFRSHAAATAKPAAPRKPQEKPKAGAKESHETTALPEKIVVMHVVAHAQGQFSGQQLQEALGKAGFVYGDMRIFHRLSGEQPVFSVANMLEPGWFDLERMDSFHTPGISLFMRLPGPRDCMAAFDDMVAAAAHLAEMLDGELRDQNRSVMSRQTIEHLREEIREFQRRLRLAQKMS